MARSVVAPTDQRGMVTVEIAIGLLSCAMILAGCIWVLSLFLTRSQCAEASYEVARQLARGDQVRAQRAYDELPRQATLTVQRQAQEVRVQCQAHRTLWGYAIPITVQVSVPYEPGESP